MDTHSPFTALLLITALAALVPVVASRITFVRVPIVVGEILAGIVIGKSGLDLVETTPTLKFLAEFGFTFLMFLSGLEVSFDMLSATARPSGTRPRWQTPVPLALICLALTITMASLAGVGLVVAGLAGNAVLMGLILSTTSLGIVVPILKERGLTTTLYGQTVLVSALISDFVTLLLLSVAIAVISKGLSLDLLFFLLLVAGFVASARISRWMSRIPGLPRIIDELSQATSQFRVRGAFALMVIWVVLADALGVELILGAFLAGAILNMSGRGHESPLRGKLDAIGYGFFIPIFFISVGAGFDLRALVETPGAVVLVLALIGTAYLVKVIPALLYRKLFSWRETLAAGVLLSSRLSLIVATAAIALELGIIGAATSSAIILVAIITCTFSPIAFERIVPVMKPKEREGVVILGTDQLANLLAQRLRQTGEIVTFIGRDLSQLEHLNSLGFRCVAGDLDDDELLERAGLGKARALIAVTNASDLIARVARRAQERFHVPIVIARADDPQTVPELEALNVRVVQPAMATALALEGALHFPAAFGMLMSNTDDVNVLDVPLGNASFAGQPLRRVRLPGDALVLGIQREGEVVVPHGDTVLRLGDTLVLVGNPEALREARQWLDA